MKHKNAGDNGGNQGTLASYMTGFILAAVLTVIPFFMVMSGTMSTKATLISISAFAILQIMVHLVYFLHMYNGSEKTWNFISLAFTVLIIAILVGGSLWIMYNLNINMMPE